MSTSDTTTTPPAERVQRIGEIDKLLNDFQRACEMVVVEGDSNVSRTTKHRAIRRLAAHVPEDRDER